MTSRPGCISQQPTSTDQGMSHTSARRNATTRSGREAFLFFAVAVPLLMVWAARTLTMGTPATPVTAIAVHTVTPQCVSAEDMARQYGFEGDWRENMMAVKELNGWDRWPILHVGDPVFVPDYRSNEEVAYGSVGPTQQSHSVGSAELSDPADPADDPAAAGSTHQNSSAVTNQQLDRSESLRPGTGRPVEADNLPASLPASERQIRGSRQGRAARTNPHGGD